MSTISFTLSHNFICKNNYKVRLLNISFLSRVRLSKVQSLENHLRLKVTFYGNTWGCITSHLKIEYVFQAKFPVQINSKKFVFLNRHSLPGFGTGRKCTHMTLLWSRPPRAGAKPYDHCDLQSLNVSY